ncbi:MAG: response regulator, partial [Cyanobacteria bacterium]|nr:response regulator [Cyanobacteriota bacterium]
MAQRILIVEDSPTQLITLRRMLESQEQSILTATNATEGLVRAYNDLPDLIVSDVVMSGINGYQLCRLVKNQPQHTAKPNEQHTNK